MDDETEDDAGYPPNPNPTTAVHRSSASSSHYYRPPQLLPPNPNPNPNSNSSSRSSLGPSIPADRANSSYHNNIDDDDVDIDDEEEEEEEDNDDEGGNALQGSGPPRTMIEDEEEEDGEDDVDQDISGDEGVGSGYPREREKYNYEFAARASPATVTAAKQIQTTLPPPPPLLLQPPQLIMAKPLPADWSESATQVLLDIWGDKFVQLGRKSLRSDEWLDVAKKVSAIAKIPHLTDAQCRNRLDTLKKKYKREKAKLEEYGSGGNSSRWIYFKRMEALMGPNSPSVAVMATPIAIIPPTTIQTSAAMMAASLPALAARKQLLACGLDSGEYVFSNSSGYPNNNKSNDGLNNVRDSSDSASDDGNDDDEDESDDSDCPPPKKVRYLPRRGSGQDTNTEEGGGDESGSFGLLAESIQKFGEIYERVENSKRQQLMEIERMRMEFQKDLEMQKRQILERAQAEIARIKEEDDCKFTPPWLTLREVKAEYHF